MCNDSIISSTNKRREINVRDTSAIFNRRIDYKSSCVAVIDLRLPPGIHLRIYFVTLNALLATASVLHSTGEFRKRESGNERYTHHLIKSSVTDADIKRN